jgi:hypothetical protein
MPSIDQAMLAGAPRAGQPRIVGPSAEEIVEATARAGELATTAAVRRALIAAGQLEAVAKTFCERKGFVPFENDGGSLLPLLHRAEVRAVGDGVMVDTTWKIQTRSRSGTQDGNPAGVVKLQLGPATRRALVEALGPHMDDPIVALP